jgi:hypothetical protein
LLQLAHHFVEHCQFFGIGQPYRSPSHQPISVT